MHGIIEADDGSFGFRSHDLFGEENDVSAKLRDLRIDTRTGFDGNDDGERIAADFKVSYFLWCVVFGYQEILLVEIADHGAAMVADSDGSGHQRDASGQFGWNFGRSLLDLGARVGGQGTLGSLGEEGSGREEEYRNAGEANWCGRQDGTRKAAARLPHSKT